MWHLETNKWIVNTDLLIKNIRLVKFLFIPLSTEGWQPLSSGLIAAALPQFIPLPFPNQSLTCIKFLHTYTTLLTGSLKISPQNYFPQPTVNILFAFLKVSQHLFYPFSTAWRIPSSKGKLLSSLCWLVLLQEGNIFIRLILRRKRHKLYLSLTNAFLAFTLRLRN